MAVTITSVFELSLYYISRWPACKTAAGAWDLELTVDSVHIHLYLYMQIHIYIYICIQMHTHTHKYTCICLYTYRNGCMSGMYTYICKGCVYASILHVYIYICTSVSSYPQPPITYRYDQCLNQTSWASPSVLEHALSSGVLKEGGSKGIGGNLGEPWGNTGEYWGVYGTPLP